MLEAADMELRKVPDRLGVMTYLYQLQAYFTREQNRCGSDNVDVDSAVGSDDDDNWRTSDIQQPQPVHDVSVSNTIVIAR